VLNNKFAIYSGDEIKTGFQYPRNPDYALFLSSFHHDLQGHHLQYPEQAQLVSPSNGPLEKGVSSSSAGDKFLKIHTSVTQLDN